MLGLFLLLSVILFSMIPSLTSGVYPVFSSLKEGTDIFILLPAMAFSAISAVTNK